MVIQADVAVESVMFCRLYLRRARSTMRCSLEGPYRSIHTLPLSESDFVSHVSDMLGILYGNTQGIRIDPTVPCR
jgi:hypothetical protein